MSRRGCDRAWEIDALREGKLGAKDAEAFARHARTCEACAATIARDARIRTLMASLPPEESNDLDLRRVRARVLHDVATGVPSRGARLVPFAAALALVFVVAVCLAFVGSRARGTGLPTPVVAAPSPPHGSPSARPAMELADAARSEDGGVGESGAAPRRGRAAIAPSRAPPRVTPPSASSGPAVVATPDEEADAYAAAITLFQSGQYAAAGSAFHAFVLAHPQAPQTEDASFLEAAALARARRPDAAALVAEDHLARFPKSFHRKEASILIARAARDRGDCAQARAVLAPWLGLPPDDEARTTLQRCRGDESTKK